MSLLATYYSLRLAASAISCVVCIVIAAVVFKRHVHKTIRKTRKEVNEYDGNTLHLLTEPDEGLRTDSDEVFHRASSGKH